MNKKILLVGFVVVILIAGVYLTVFNKPKKPISPIADFQKVIRISPSETLKEYTDLAGFQFTYPDNISIQTNEGMGAATYADLQLFSKEISGSLNIKIADSSFKSIEEWLKLYKSPTSKKSKLGDLDAVEIKTTDRLILAALDQGVLFSIEMPLLEEDFWTKVYSQVVGNFSFAAPATSQVAGGSDIVFEGEEVIE